MNIDVDNCRPRSRAFLTLSGVSERKREPLIRPIVANHAGMKGTLKQTRNSLVLAESAEATTNGNSDFVEFHAVKLESHIHYLNL